MECVVGIKKIKKYHEVKNYKRLHGASEAFCFTPQNVFVRRHLLLFYTTPSVSMCQAPLALATGSACQGLQVMWVYCIIRVILVKVIIMLILISP